MVDNGKLSTILITILTPIFGYIITDPQPFQDALNQAGLGQYIPLIFAIVVCTYNYLYPRSIGE